MERRVALTEIFGGTETNLDANDAESHCATHPITEPQLDHRRSQSPRHDPPRRDSPVTAETADPAGEEALQELLLLMLQRKYDEALVAVRKLAVLFPDHPTIRDYAATLPKYIAHKAEEAAKAELEVSSDHGGEEEGDSEDEDSGEDHSALSESELESGTDTEEDQVDGHDAADTTRARVGAGPSV
ncbi:hypothetical protein GGF31_003604 [Allomyces arbusculus]|nr:hypothetical protein GGF31_003604 [Allomyces arbusculus]